MKRKVKPLVGRERLRIGLITVDGALYFCVAVYIVAWG